MQFPSPPHILSSNQTDPLNPYPTRHGIICDHGCISGPWRNAPILSLRFHSTGNSDFLQFEFVRQLSSDPKNIVIALVRNKPATEQAVAAEIARDNVFVVEGDITNYDSLKVRQYGFFLSLSFCFLLLEFFC